MKKWLAFCLLSSALCLLNSCGSGEPPPPTPHYITLVDGTRCVVYGNSIDCEER